MVGMVSACPVAKATESRPPRLRPVVAAGFVPVFSITKGGSGSIIPRRRFHLHLDGR